LKKADNNSKSSIVNNQLNDPSEMRYAVTT
jgi:hypothetical protein